MKTKVLVETALLGQGLPSVFDNIILAGWHEQLAAAEVALAWVWQGEVMIGSFAEFLLIRQTPDMGRFDANSLEQAKAEHLSGFLTAGGTMAVAAANKVEYVATCGMGGIFDGRITSDLPALCELPVRLIATAPKDMLEAEPIIRYLNERGCKVYGTSPESDGFMFVKSACPLNGTASDELPSDCALLFNRIPHEWRLTDAELLPEAVAAGRAAVEQGGSFHPAVNKYLDVCTNGESSLLQLWSLVENIKLALSLSA